MIVIGYRAVGGRKTKGNSSFGLWKSLFRECVPSTPLPTMTLGFENFFNFSTDV